MKTEIEILQISTLSDNYVHVIFHEDIAIVVDPASSGSVLQEIESRRCSLSSILVTHHHFDHTGGVADIKQASGCTVYGFNDRRIPGLDSPIEDGQEFDIEGLRIVPYHVPGHTKSHLAYFFPDYNYLFSGDTLFAAGCGRLFEGNAEQMWRSLKILMQLPGETKIYCGHEYTVENLRFAHSIEPQNIKVKQRLEHSIALRSSNKSTLPTSLDLEKQTNPFLRIQDPDLRKAVNMIHESDVKVFASIREQKDRF